MFKYSKYFGLFVKLAEMSADKAAEMLGVSVDIPLDDLKKLHKALVLKYHPDRNRDPEAADRMKFINVAVDVLKKRAPTTTTVAPKPTESKSTTKEQELLVVEIKKATSNILKTLKKFLGSFDQEAVISAKAMYDEGTKEFIGSQTNVYFKKLPIRLSFYIDIIYTNGVAYKHRVSITTIINDDTTEHAYLTEETNESDIIIIAENLIKQQIRNINFLYRKQNKTNKDVWDNPDFTGFGVDRDAETPEPPHVANDVLLESQIAQLVRKKSDLIYHYYIQSLNKLRAYPISVRKEFASRAVDLYAVSKQYDPYKINPDTYDKLPKYSLLRALPAVYDDLKDKFIKNNEKKFEKDYLINLFETVVDYHAQQVIISKYDPYIYH